MFKNAVLSRYIIEGEKNWNGETYWCCFAYDDIHPDDLHCTHKYFGEQSENTIKEIENTIAAYFARKPFVPFQVKFDKVDWFGQDKTVRVLRPSGKDDQSPFRLDLRKELDSFAEDSYPGGYKPHVSCDEEVVDMPFTRYLLCQGDTILREWK